MELYLYLCNYICIRRFFVSAVAKLELLRLNPGELCFVSPVTSYFCLPDRSSTIWVTTNFAATIISSVFLRDDRIIASLILLLLLLVSFNDHLHTSISSTSATMINTSVSLSNDWLLACVTLAARCYQATCVSLSDDRHSVVSLRAMGPDHILQLRVARHLVDLVKCDRQRLDIKCVSTHL